MSAGAHPAAAADLPEALRLAECLERDCDMNWPDHDNQMNAAAELRRLHALTASAPAASSAAPAVVAWELVHSVLGPELTAHKSRADEAERLGILVHPLCRASAFAYAAPTAPQAGAQAEKPFQPMAVLTEAQEAQVRAMHPTPQAGAESHPPALTRQQVVDRFGFLEGLVSEGAYRRIVDKACELYGEGAATAALRARGAVPDSVVLGAEAAEWIGGAEKGQITTTIGRLGGAVAAAIRKHAAPAAPSAQAAPQGPEA